MIKFLKKTVIGVLAWAAMSTTHAATITFDGLADGTVINNYYAGLTFSNPVGGGDIYARTSSFNASGNNVVSVFGTGIPAFNAYWGAIDILFSTLQNNVSIAAAAMAGFEGLGTPQNKPYLQAFDQYNNLLGTTYFSGSLPTGVAEVTPFELLSFSGIGNNIAKVRLSVQQGAGGPIMYGLFDNLSYNTTNGDGSGGTQVPEPVSLALLGLGLYGMVAARRRKS